ncbi:hypothetical protein JOE56_002085 [Brevibacterium paucivorans]|uniref:HNH nuclease domain-containing protein n=1 Tax=Brevibacterium paucivorans TaxID=170994 RepID=A0ABS2SQV6_9MICO|nr:HNH endonuclease signature motif containing protein [Brevibacterium paucivorans]MBM7817391.1 hypothetical protein [Brevibacterium paucivorans]
MYERGIEERSCREIDVLTKARRVADAGLAALARVVVQHFVECLPVMTPKQLEKARLEASKLAELSGTRGAPTKYVRIDGVGYVLVEDIVRLQYELPIEDVGIFATALDCTGRQVTSRLRPIVTMALLMPGLWSYVQNGQLSYERVRATAAQVAMAGIDIIAFDRLMMDRRLDVSPKVFRKYVNEIIAMLSTPQETNEIVKENRRVVCTHNPGGESVLSLIGPSIEIEAMFKRLEGGARAVIHGAIGSFSAHIGSEEFTPTTEVPVRSMGEVEIDEERLLHQVMYDMAIGARPATQIKARITRTGKTKPASVTQNDDVPAPQRVDEAVEMWLGQDEARGASEVKEVKLTISIPTNEEWLKSQAGISVMVPLIQFMDNEGRPPEIGDRPAEIGGDNLPDIDEGEPGAIDRDGPHELGRTELQKRKGPATSRGSTGPPVPVMVNNEFALDSYTTDKLLRQASSVYRYFTDPSTGEVCEIMPTRYRVTKQMARTLEARWVYCSAPWCSRLAKACDKDHIVPFDQANPQNGGQTILENLQPLCRRHHQAKTEGHLSARRTDDGGVEWEFPRIGTVLSYPPASPLNQSHYKQLEAFAKSFS